MDVEGYVAGSAIITIQDSASESVSVPVTVIPATAVPSPPVLQLSTSDLAVTLAWDAVEGATGYILGYSSKYFPTENELGDVGRQRYFQFELPGGSAYSVWIYAYNSVGRGDRSNIESFVLCCSLPLVVNPSDLNLKTGETVSSVISGGVGYYGADCSDLSVAQVSVSGSMLEVLGVTEGSATVTVSDGASTVTTVKVTVRQDPELCSYVLSSTSQTFPSSGGSGSVSVSALTGCAWSASSNNNWITIASGGSGNGTGTVSYSVSANTSTSSRTGTMTIAEQTFTVTQDGVSCSYSLSSTSQTFPSSGGSGSVRVSTPTGCAWSASSNNNWITIASGGSGNGTGTVSYSVSVNTGASSRTGTMTIAEQTFTVTQDGVSCSYILSSTSQTFSSSGGSGSVSVSALTGCTWSASSNNNWITIVSGMASGGSGNGTGTVSYSVSANTNTSSRTGTMTIAEQTFTVTQDQGGLPDLGMTFALIPAGTFTMGSPSDELGRDSDETQHEVTLTQPFYMQTTEVTQVQWESVMGSNPSYFDGCPTCPVENVSWNDVQEFIVKMNARGEGTYSLPTEAQWEYAARAGSTTAFYNGGITSYSEMYACNYDPNLNAIGWYCYNAGSKTHRVAGKTPNAYGLYDMSGNVWEWCQDSWGSNRVLRGGCWRHYAGLSRSASRYGSSPDRRNYNIGFRLKRQP